VLQSVKSKESERSADTTEKYRVEIVLRLGTAFVGQIHRQLERAFELTIERRFHRDHSLIFSNDSSDSLGRNCIGVRRPMPQHWNAITRGGRTNASLARPSQSLWACHPYRHRIARAIPLLLRTTLSNCERSGASPMALTLRFFVVVCAWSWRFSFLEVCRFGTSWIRLTRVLPVGPIREFVLLRNS